MYRRNDAGRHRRDDFGKCLVLRDSGSDREDDDDERDVFYDIRSHWRNFSSERIVLWDAWGHRPRDTCLGKYSKSDGHRRGHN